MLCTIYKNLDETATDVVTLKSSFFTIITSFHSLGRPPQVCIYVRVEVWFLLTTFVSIQTMNLYHVSPRISLIITSTSTLRSRVAVSDETLKAWRLSSVFTEDSVSLTCVSAHFGSSLENWCVLLLVFPTAHDIWDSPKISRAWTSQFSFCPSSASMSFAPAFSSPSSVISPHQLRLL